VKNYRIGIIVGVLGLVALLVWHGGRSYEGAGVVYAAGININSVTESTPGTVGTANCNWNIAPYCRVVGTATALTALTYSNPVDGNDYVFEFDQDATGEPMTLPTNVEGPDGVTAMSGANSVASAVSIYRMTWNAGLSKYITTNLTANAAQANLHNNCVTSMTLSSGAQSTTGAPACFANYSKVGWYVGLAGSPTGAISTPTGTLLGTNSRVACAQAAAGSLTINCRSADSADANVVVVYGVN
jgi:hypothetical protein